MYIDDVLIASTTPEEHLQHLRVVFERLTAYGMVINPNKCIFGVPELDFLGHHIDRNGITPLQSKVQAVKDFPRPSSQRQLRRFLGLVNYRIAGNIRMVQNFVYFVCSVHIRK